MNLKNYYCLNYEPTREEELDWLENTENMIESGLNIERAGFSVAKKMFSATRHQLNDSQADTIADLIMMLKQKKGSK